MRTSVVRAREYVLSGSLELGYPWDTALLYCHAKKTIASESMSSNESRVVVVHNQDRFQSNAQTTTITANAITGVTKEWDKGVTLRDERNTNLYSKAIESQTLLDFPLQLFHRKPYQTKVSKATMSLVLNHSLCDCIEIRMAHSRWLEYLSSNRTNTTLESQE